MLALNQLEKAYVDNNSRGLEIEKIISLMQLNPKALMDLINTGECIFELSEKLFDGDFPGHYARKIKSISISLPAVIGPYQNIKASLIQLSNQVIIKPDPNAVNFLLGGKNASMPEAKVLRSNWLINQQIAISKGVNDSGLFELNFNDERYLPFEGTGAVSSWKLSMPKTTNPIDFNKLSDVIIQIKYTAKDGGSKFRSDVTHLDAMKTYPGNNCYIMAQNFSSQWYDFLNNPTGKKAQTLQFELIDTTPPHVGNSKLASFYFELQTPEGVNPVGNANFINLQLTDSITTGFNLDKNGCFLHTFQTPPPLSKTEGMRSLEFNLDLTPQDLKTEEGYLNPDAIQNIVLVLFLTGDINWD